MSRSANNQQLRGAAAYNPRAYIDSPRGGPSNNRAKSADRRKVRRLPVEDFQRHQDGQNSLDAYGLEFKNGKLVSITDGQPFQFHLYGNDDDNRKRYNAIGRLVTTYIYGLLEKECNLIRIPIPTDPKRSESTGFFFASYDLNTAPYLMIIIHGTGAVRAGQWSRKLIINENIKTGSQIDYIKRAQELGFAVIVTNTNLHTDESSESVFDATSRIRGSGSPEEHACYVWENFVRQCPARHICIAAHSYGGAVVLALASKFTREFDKRVFAVALSDSPMRAYTKHSDKNVLAMLRKRTVNWAADNHPINTFLFDRDYGQVRSAANPAHEWTPYTSFAATFNFFEERLKAIQNKH